ncbi:MAG: site-specific DNA-methyltransferase [Desulfurellales bacterium]|nr:MAG: site-specific DNA-methyltransferase [Desulfurellales bacterium]
MATIYRKSEIPSHLQEFFCPAEIGLEATVDAYVAEMVSVFREVRRVLAEDGVLWLNLGDSYAGGHSGSRDPERWPKQSRNNNGDRMEHARKRPGGGLKPKDLIGVPWRVAFALQADGWWLRSDCVWNKPNAMPESVRDRPTKAHEYVFLLTRSERYAYYGDEVRTPAKESSITRLSQDIDAQGGSDRVPGKTNGAMKAVIRMDKQRGHGRRHEGFNARWDAMSRDEQMALGAQLRTVWTIATSAFKGAHFATFPPALAEICIKSGSQPGDTVLDPFFGAGTVGLVADRLGRDAIGIELNPAYAEMARRRITNDAPLLVGVS